MQKRDCLNRIENWLKYRGAGIGMKESFEKQAQIADILKEMSLSYTKWLILPGEENREGMSEEEAGEWNEILMSVFARLPAYQEKEDALWDRLARLFETLLQKRKNDGQKFRLLERSAPEGEEALGRKTELEQTAETLQKEGTAFLYGIGGIGKSTVAKAYVREYAAQYDTVVYAVCNRGLRELFADDSLICVQNMIYTPQGKRAELGWYARRKLKTIAKITDERTLLVIDNFDNLRDPLLLETLRLPCHLLVTTRMNPACIGRNGIEVLALKENDLLRLFSFYYRETLSGKEKEDVLSVFRTFRGHTLYGMLWARECAVKKIPPSVRAAELFRIKKHIFGLLNFSKKEQEILKNASLLPVTGMEMKRFLRLCRHVEESLVWKLKDGGILEYDAGRNNISLHPVVCREILETLNPSWSDCRVFLSDFVQETSDFWNMPVREKMKYQAYISAVFDALPLIEESCMDLIFELTDLLWQLGLWSFARSHTQALYQQCCAAFGRSHPDTARAAHLAASVYHNQNERKCAALWYERAWAAYRDLEEKDPFSEALYRMKYSRYLTLHGKYEEAKETLLCAEEIYLAEIAADRNARVMSCWLQNAYIEHTRVCMEEQKNEEALVWCQKAKEIAKELKEGGATGVYILYDEAVLRERLGDFSRAGKCLSMARKLAEKYFDENYPERLKIKQAWKKREGET